MMEQWALSLAAVPGDLLLEIAAHLDCRTDIFNFCLTSNKIFSSVSSILYTAVTLNSAEQCAVTLGMLRRRPDIARHVRELKVRPGVKGNPKDQIYDSVTASAAVREIAMSKVLDALVKFTWDHDEIPYHDDMWFALRVCCTQLRYVNASMGSIMPLFNSNLFDFVDLRGFSLYLKQSFFEGQIDMFLDEEQPVSRRFWHMLMDRCPNLEELTIDGDSSFPSDVHQLVHGRWPKLRKLILGNVAVDWIPGHALALPGRKSPFVEFLEAHPNLQNLGLSRSNVGHTQLTTLSPDALRLQSFSGTLEQLQALPQMYDYLESVSFREPMQTREVTALAVAGLLQRLKSLTTLKISFMLHSMYDSGNLLRSLIASCPNLRHLELTCGHKPSFQLDSFSKTIRGFSKLRTLHLTIVKYPGDENLAAGAARIAMTNPRLQNFSLTFLPPTYPLILPFPLPLFFPLRTKSSGFFTLTCDKHGIPQTLRAFERRRLIWPLGLGYSYRTKRYTSDLRPAGSPGKRKQGLKGVSSLVLENSPAGEEMRMILFCGLLVVLAVWGFMAGVPHNRSSITAEMVIRP